MQVLLRYWGVVAQPRSPDMSGADDVYRGCVVSDDAPGGESPMAVAAW